MMNLMKRSTKKYHVELKNNKIVLLDNVEDPNLKNKIENFKFFSQYADFRDLKNYKMEIYQVQIMCQATMQNIK